MAQKKRRQKGMGGLVDLGDGRYQLRWRENQLRSDGSMKVINRQCTVRMSLKEANHALQEHCVKARHEISQEPITFEDFASRWKTDILPTYKHATRKGHAHILKKHLIPAFGDLQLKELTTERIQRFVTERIPRYSPNTLDHYHNVLSTILGKAVLWGYVSTNAAHGVRLPRLRPVTDPWVFTVGEAETLLESLDSDHSAHFIVSLALLTGFRQSELFALQWGDFDPMAGQLIIRRSVYDGVVDETKTASSTRGFPLCRTAIDLLKWWNRRLHWTADGDWIFSSPLKRGTRRGSQRILRDHVYPACKRLGLKNPGWRTFRRTFATWQHERGIPIKVVSQLMGHANVSTTMNVYTQVLPEAAQRAMDGLGDELLGSLFADSSRTNEYVN